MNINQSFSINEKQLKIFAIICMVMDHIACYAIASNTTLYVVLRLFGRLSFVIFAFMIVEGNAHTKNRGKYILRLLLLAIISEPIYDWFFSGGINFNDQNIFFTLLIGELVLFVFFKIQKHFNSSKKISIFYKILLMCLTTIGALCLTNFINDISNCAGVLLIVLFYLFWNNNRFNKNIYRILFPCLIMTIVWLIIGTPIQFFSLFAVIFILPLYNGQRGNQKRPLLFYFFYPAHLLAIGGITTLINFIVV